MDFLKNKSTQVGLGVLILAIVAVGGYFLLISKSQSNEPATPEEEKVLTLSPEEIGLELSLSEDQHKVVMEITKVDDIETINYDLSYTAEGDIPRTVLGEGIEPKGKPVRKSIDLGTCSDVCHYDENVSDIEIIVKVIKTDGKTYQVEKSLEE